MDIADDPERCLATNDDGSPLSMEDLAEHHKSFGRLWRKAKGRRVLVVSVLNSECSSFTREELKEALSEDREYCDAMNACRVAYDQYLLIVDPDNFYGVRDDESPFQGADLAALMARQEEIHALANDDPEFADLLDRYETLSRDITACKLIGQLDDKTWEKRRYEEGGADVFPCVLRGVSEPPTPVVDRIAHRPAPFSEVLDPAGAVSPEPPVEHLDELRLGDAAPVAAIEELVLQVAEESL